MSYGNRAWTHIANDMHVHSARQVTTAINISQSRDYLTWPESRNLLRCDSTVYCHVCVIARYRDTQLTSAITGADSTGAAGNMPLSYVVKCLNKWIGNAPRKTILQLSTLTPIISPQTPHPPNWDLLLIYCISLSWSRGNCIYVATKLGKYHGLCGSNKLLYKRCV